MTCMAWRPPGLCSVSEAATEPRSYSATRCDDVCGGHHGHGVLLNPCGPGEGQGFGSARSDQFRIRRWPAQSDIICPPSDSQR